MAPDDIKTYKRLCQVSKDGGCIKEGEFVSFDSRYNGSVIAKSYMAAAPNPQATLAGLEVLRSGGNAMDACLAMASVTSVVLPQMCGLGGDAFFIYYDAQKGTTVALNGSGFAGDDATIDKYKSVGELLPQDGIHSVAVPGAPMVFHMAARRFGSMGLEKCFEYGVKVAREGFPVSAELSRAIALEEKKLNKYPEIGGIFMPQGRFLKPGDVLLRPDLADTLEQFGRHGASYFYRGELAHRFYALNRKTEGAFSGAEFARFMDKEGPAFYEPLQTDYRGYAILETAPVSQGFIVLEQMNILEQFDLDDMEPDGADAIHLMVEAKKIAFKDRNLYAGDPQSCDFDVSKFISKGYGNEMARKININKTENSVKEVGNKGDDTTSFVAWDAQGNACTFIHSIAFQFGSGLIIPGTGVILNNRAGRSFVLTEGHPNSLRPGTRPMHTLNCYMVQKHGKPFIVGGTPGGDGQPQWNMQMLSLMLDHGAGPQDAVDYPRWISVPGTDVIGLGAPSQIRLESRFPKTSIIGLKKKGHMVRALSQWGGGGGAQMIMQDPRSGTLLGGSDRRVGGIALGG